MNTGDGTKEKLGTIGKFHEHRDGSVGWNTYSSAGEKIHITGTDISKDDDRNRNILTNLLGLIFGTDNK